MENKYNRSFVVEQYKIPRKCPICGMEFDKENKDYEEYKVGIRTVLACSKCNYKKVLDYTKYKDIKAAING